MKPSNTALGQPILQRLLVPGVGWTDLPSPCHCIGKHHTMVNVFVGWSTALVSRQSLLFLCEQTLDKVDWICFSQYSTKFLKIKCYTYCELEFLDRPRLSVTTRTIIQWVAIGGRTKWPIRMHMSCWLHHAGHFLGVKQAKSKEKMRSQISFQDKSIRFVIFKKVFLVQIFK